jgi:GntR family transcriptional regulator
MTRGLKRQGIPLYIQLEEIFQSQIVTGEFVPGQRIPSENEIANAYKVSLITVRQSISNLVQKGILVRKQGVGTFVRDSERTVKNIMTLNAKGRLDEVVPEGVLKQEVEVVDMSPVSSTKYVADKFGIGEGETVYRVVRRRKENGAYLSYIKNYLPVDIGKRIKRSDLLTNTMLAVLKGKLGINLIKGVQLIESILADYEIAENLSIHMTSPVLYLEMLSFDEKDKIVNFVQTFFRADIFKYTINFDFQGIA